MHKKKVYHIRFEKIASTNDWVKANAAFFDPNELICVTATEQTAGHGRYERPWVSERGNIYLTLFFSLPLSAQEVLPNLAQVVALACTHLLEERGVSLQVKWPNDLTYQGKKCGGILTETIALEGRIGIALGLGLNVNTPAKGVDQPVISLSEIVQTNWSVDELIPLLIKAFQKNLDRLLTQGFTPFKEVFEGKMAMRGERISCQWADQRLEAICHSLTDDGKLILTLPDGHQKIFSAGEIHSLRNIEL